MPCRRAAHSWRPSACPTAEQCLLGCASAHLEVPVRKPPRAARRSWSSCRSALLALRAVRLRPVIDLAPSRPCLEPVLALFSHPVLSARLACICCRQLGTSSTSWWRLPATTSSAASSTNGHLHRHGRAVHENGAVASRGHLSQAPTRRPGRLLRRRARAAYGRVRAGGAAAQGCREGLGRGGRWQSRVRAAPAVVGSMCACAPLR